MDSSFPRPNEDPPQPPPPGWTVTIEPTVERHCVAEPAPDADPLDPADAPEPQIVETSGFLWRAEQTIGFTTTAMVSFAATLAEAEADARAYVQQQVDAARVAAAAAVAAPEAVVLNFDAEGNDLPNPTG